MSTSPEIAHYRVPETSAVPLDNHFILLSYLDVVVQGFLHEFGPEGVTRFFETTVGWQTPIFNDRATPEYPRHQRLTPEETDLVDHHLEALSARLKER